MMSMIEKVAFFEIAFAIRENIEPDLRNAGVDTDVERASFYRDLHEYIEDVNDSEDESVALSVEERLCDFLNYRASKMIDDAKEGS